MKKVFISTIGKVGSSSLKNAFVEAGFRPFNDNVESIAQVTRSKSNITVSTHNINYTCYAISEALSNNHKCFVFVGARDILKRHISAFFQNIENEKNFYWYLPNWKLLSVEELHKEFERRVLVHTQLLAGDWFLRFTQKNSIPESEINQKLQEVQLDGISFLNLPRRGSLTYIFYQLEKLNSNWHRIRNYIECPQFPPFPLEINKATSKNVSDVYINFLKSYVPSPIVLEKSYNCDLSKFYTRDEIDHQIGAWQFK